MPSVLIVEDEPRTAEMLTELIESKTGYKVTALLDSVDATVNYLKKNQDDLDIIFLDIHLADGESFQVFEETEVQVPVIFCTAYDEYLLKAFKHNGIDYILKPFKKSDIHEALSKFENLKLSFTQTDKKSKDTGSKKAFLVHFRGRTIPISIEQIAVLLIDEGITYLFNQKGESFHISKTMDEMEQGLPEEHFFRVNRQMILNRDAILEIVPYFNRKVVVKLNVNIPEQVIVSRLKVTAFMKWLEQ